MNSNAKFTGFSPEELAAEPETPKEEPVELDATTAQFKDSIGYSDFLSPEDFKSPDNGQTVGGILIAEAEKTAKKHKKKSKYLPASFLGSGPNSSIADPSGIYYGYVHPEAAKDLKLKPGSLIPVNDLEQAQVNAKLDAGTYYSYPSSATMASGTPYQTYIMGKDAVFNWADPVTDQYKKEADYWKSQTEEAKEIIKQLSGEPGEFIYIHPFDLYELLNSFVIPVSLNVDSEMKDAGFIEINGKKYKQSVLMPIKSKNSFVDASKYQTPQTQASPVKKEYPW